MKTYVGKEILPFKRSGDRFPPWWCKLNKKAEAIEDFKDTVDCLEPIYPHPPEEFICVKKPKGIGIKLVKKAVKPNSEVPVPLILKQKKKRGRPPKGLVPITQVPQESEIREKGLTPEEVKELKERRRRDLNNASCRRNRVKKNQNKERIQAKMDREEVKERKKKEELQKKLASHEKRTREIRRRSMKIYENKVKEMRHTMPDEFRWVQALVTGLLVPPPLAVVHQRSSGLNPLTLLPT